MQAGADAVIAASQTAIFIDPAQALSKIRQVESILADLVGVVRVCDPYANGRTLDLLAECSAATELRLLKAKISNPNTFKRDVQLFNQQRGGILEVRVAAPGHLHDRYAIDDDGMVLFGTSLNSMGRKQSFVVSLGHDLRTSVMPAFDNHWAVATPA